MKLTIPEEFSLYFSIKTVSLICLVASTLAEAVLATLLSPPV